MQKNSKTEKFCHSILGLEVQKSKAFANLVMGLASQTWADSVTSISLSRCYHYQFSSISKVLESLYRSGDGEEEEGRLRLEKILAIKKDHLAKPFSKFWLLNTDISTLLRPHSKCLPDRRYVYKPNNQVKSNKPVEVGWEFSTVGLSARQPHYGMSEPPWNLPLSMRLVPFEANRNSFTAHQVNDLLDNEDLDLGKALCVNTLDSQYSSPEYIADTHHQPHLVNIIRFPSNRKVWKGLSGEEQQARKQNNTDNRGALAIYGQKYKLSQAEDWDLPADQSTEFGHQLANGRKCVVKIDIWEEMMIRSKRGKNMKDKTFRLVRIQLLDGLTGLPLFQRPMWLSVWGERRGELTPEEIYWAYRSRFDIEHFFRFGKQRLLLDDFQTPDPEHWQNWLEVVNCAYWLLWVAREEAHHQAKKWQQYDKNFKKRKEFDLPVAPTLVQQQLATIILSFEQEPFLPKLQIKGEGRKIGTRFPKRPYRPVRKKPSKTQKAKA
jgi:hypothetical protein